MTSEEMLRDLTGYFAGKYPDKQFQELGRICGNIHEDDRYKVWEFVRDNNKPNYRIGVNAIVEACHKLAVPYRKNVAQTAEVIDWTCECGIQFRYQLGASSDRHGDRIYDICPRCGFDPQIMKKAQAEADRREGPKPEWYYRMFSEYHKAHCLPGQEPHIDRTKDRAAADKDSKARSLRFKEIIDEEEKRLTEAKRVPLEIKPAQQQDIGNKYDRGFAEAVNG